jgi:hypothetical protein
MSVARGHGAEDVFHAIMQFYLRGQGFERVKKPPDLKGIYGQRTTGNPHGIRPEYAVRHKASGRTIFVEIKRQRASGNAHERACKYFAPGIVESSRQIARLPEGTFPFWLIFTNGIATDPNYRREITHWFRGFEGHLLLWPSVDHHDALIDHFDTHIRPILEGSPNP